MSNTSLQTDDPEGEPQSDGEAEVWRDKGSGSRSHPGGAEEAGVMAAPGPGWLEAEGVQACNQTCHCVV